MNIKKIPLRTRDNFKIGGNATNTFACGAWVAESTHCFGTESTQWLSNLVVIESVL
jgi:hypothetical protein